MAGIDDIRKNTHWWRVVEGSPSERCRTWIINSLLFGAYCGFDSENPKIKWEEGLTAEDWKYVLRTMGGNSRLEPKCIKRISELEKREQKPDA